ncbi:MAG: hypothetical protein HC831_20480 [Chloroflexia bacterium]|nr:hypothetical protein [Chloroflexia bacterium]
MKSLRQTRAEVQAANKQLKELNVNLQNVNEELNGLNHELFESNHVKEQYIANFFKYLFKLYQ